MKKPNWLVGETVTRFQVLIKRIALLSDLFYLILSSSSEA
jgi:hypothetical protein